MTNWHKLKRQLTIALDNPPPHTDKATIAQVLFLMATMEEHGSTYTLKEETQ